MHTMSNPATSVMPETRQDFSKYERLLWGVLAQLARRGYVAPPGEGRDLIHDFYLDAWAGLLERYDAKLARFETYLFGAFYQFARRRILNLQNWRARLVDVSHLADHAAESPGPGERLQALEETRAVRDGLSRLSPRHREVLNDFLGGEQAGERELASRHGISRYELRETLIDALGRIAAEIEQHSPHDSIEGRVAFALWREARPVRDVAALLGMPVVEVQQVRRRIGLRLMESLRGDGSAKTERSKPMTKDSLQLLKDAILSVDRKDLLEILRQNARGILEALDERDIEFSEAEIESMERHPEWVAEVYQALEDSEEAQEADNEIAEAIRQIRDNEDIEIGVAFAHSVTTLPENFCSWGKWFEGVPLVDKDYQAHLREQGVVKAAQPVSEGLIKYGMSPATFQGAARGLELLLDRQFAALRASSGARGRNIEMILSWSGEKAGYPAMPLSRELVLAQICGGPHCPPEAADPVLRWMIDVAQLRPFWVRGYRADTVGRGVIALVPDASFEKADLIARWSRDAAAVRAVAAAAAMGHAG